MRIVVTGALGHIGSHLVRMLPDEFPGAEILLVDNLSTQRYCSLFLLPDAARYRFVEADVLTADLEPLFSGADAVLHLAALTDAASSIDCAAEVEAVNFRGTTRVAEACLGVRAPLAFLSTASVYGPQGSVVDEDCPASDLRPQSPYAESKLRAERWIRDLARRGLRQSVLRFGTIVGPSPGMRFHTAINKFVWQACMGIPVTVWRTAMDQRRPYLALDDAVRALAFVVGRQVFDGQVYNVVTRNVTVRQILAMIRTHIRALCVQYVDTPIMNQLSYTVSRARFERLGFRFRGSLEAEIAASVALLRAANACSDLRAHEPVRATG